MTILPEQGASPLASYHELTPLEQAIARFEEKAKAYYSKQSKIPPVLETPEQKLAREKASYEALKHLQSEKRLAMVQVQVQSRLEEYRSLWRASDTHSRGEKKEMRQAMLNEKHHPTKVLATFMRASGRPQPAQNFTAHHLVPGRGRTERAAMARVTLHFYNIRINDPDNGVWLPRTKKDKGHWAMPSAPAHAEIHTHNYELWIAANITDGGSEAMLRARLQRLRFLLRDGRQPERVTQRPDSSWSGK